MVCHDTTGRILSKVCRPDRGPVGIGREGEPSPVVGEPVSMHVS
jgi:hypothetical protein